MKCTNCKFSFDDENRICPNCGAEIYFDEDSDYEQIYEDSFINSNNKKLYDINIDDSKVEIIDIFNHEDEGLTLDEKVDEDNSVDLDEKYEEDKNIVSTYNEKNDDDINLSTDNIEDEDDKFSDTIITNSNFEVFDPEDNRYNDVDIIKPRDNIEENINIGVDNKVFEKKYLIYIILLIIVIIVILSAIYMSSSRKRDLVEDNHVVDETPKYNKIVYYDRVFELPMDYDYSFSDDSIVISNKEEWSFRIKVNSGKFKQLVSRVDELHNILKKKDFICEKADKKTINGLEIITMEVQEGKQNGLVLLADNGGNSYFTITVVNKENSIDYGILDDIINIVKTSEKYEKDDIIGFDNIGKEFENIAK